MTAVQTRLPEARADLRDAAEYSGCHQEAAAAMATALERGRAAGLPEKELNMYKQTSAARERLFAASAAANGAGNGQFGSVRFGSSSSQFRFRRFGSGPMFVLVRMFWGSFPGRCFFGPEPQKLKIAETMPIV